MKNKIIFLIIILSVFIISTSCQSSNEKIEHEGYEEKEETLDIVPFKERKFIYRNGLDIEFERESLIEDNKNIEKFYPQIKGLINKDIEKEINEDIVNLVNMRLNEVENSITSKFPDTEIQSISTSAYVDYNCNNVIFIEYFSDITYNSGTVSESYYFTKTQGYDLNTGSTISLKDLFKQGIDYNKILNDYIYMEIIKSNFDDPDSRYMNKPFQGIQDDQSFSFDENRLLIIMDDKNEEFNHNGYHLYINISLKDIGEHLAIFDRYFDEENNIFENERIKKLMSNYAYYHIDSGIMEFEEYYNIHIETGEFLGIDNIETKKLLDSMVTHDLDVEEFRERAKAYTSSYPVKYYGHLGHHVDVMMSEGGYFSLVAYSYKTEINNSEGYHKYINFNLNNKKVMTVNDVFIDGFDYNSEIVEIINTNQNYHMPWDIFSESEEILISESDFNFSQDAILIILYQPGTYVREYQQWIEYKDVGYENISILQ